MKLARSFFAFRQPFVDEPTQSTAKIKLSGVSRVDQAVRDCETTRPYTTSAL